MKNLMIFAATSVLLATSAYAGEVAVADASQMSESETANQIGDQDHKSPHKKVIIKKKKSSGKHTAKRHRRGRRPRHVASPVVAHRRRVVVHRRRPAVHSVQAVPVRHRSVTHRQYRQRPPEDGMLGIGLRLSGVTVDGEKLNLATVENPTMGGLGLQFRGKVSSHVGLELAMDVLYGQTDDMRQTTVPVTLSALYYFIPRGTFKLYGLLGGGVHFTKLEYNFGMRHDLAEIAGQAGGGIELRLSRDFSINADMRFIGLYKNIDEMSSIQSKCISHTGMQCGGITDTDRFNVGAQFMAGANFYF